MKMGSSDPSAEDQLGVFKMKVVWEMGSVTGTWSYGQKLKCGRALEDYICGCL